MKFSNEGLRELELLEGYETKTYLDSAGLPTIGIGTLIDTAEEKVAAADGFTREEAYRFARIDLIPMEAVINRLVKVSLTQNQYDALVLLVYNIGVGGFSGSTVLKLINARAPLAEVEKAWKAWNKAKVNGVKKVIPGLVNRRVKEWAIYTRGGVSFSGVVSTLLLLAAACLAVFLYLKYSKK